jgi:hypothetical protein
VKTQFIWTALVLVAALLTSSDVRAGDQARHRKTLAGVPSVHILVEELSDDLKKAGLSTAMLQTDAELRLRTVGIRVATEDESFSLPGSPYLYVAVTGIKDATTTGKYRGYSAAVELQFVQAVGLNRDPSIRVEAPTWSIMNIVTGSTVEVIRKSVRDFTDHFANAYLTANPKR